MRKIAKGTEVVVRHILGETAEGLVTRLKNGKYRFNCDAYVKGEYCKGGFYHLRQARKVISGKELGNNVKFWPRLRKALQMAGVKPVNIPGGDCPIHYQDEMVIPDYAVSGAHYFVVKYADIGKYLKKLPLDQAGKLRAKEMEEAFEEAERQRNASWKIGEKLWHSGATKLEGEFKKITLVAADDFEFSLIYPAMRTDLMWHYRCNCPKVVCEAPETGIEYLSGFAAGYLDPRKHARIKKSYSNGLHEECAYLMPNPELADEVRESDRWLKMFDTQDNDGIALALILNAKKVILEAYDLNDNLVKERYVYDSASGTVAKEYLHDRSIEAIDEGVRFDWRVEPEE